MKPLFRQKQYSRVHDKLRDIADYYVKASDEYSSPSYKANLQEQLREIQESGVEAPDYYPTNAYEYGKSLSDQREARRKAIKELNGRLKNPSKYAARDAVKQALRGKI